MTPLRVVLADDHALVRAGIRALLERMDGVEVVGEASDGYEALALVSSVSPDIVLMDITMPRMSGLAAVARLARDFPGVRVVMLSVHSDEEYVREVLGAGASGYLLKDASDAELGLAIRSVALGGRYLSPAVSSVVIEGWVGQRSGSRIGGIKLTLRQREVLQLLAEGQSTKEIAQTLSVSPKTVESHRSVIMKRLGVGDVATLVHYAIRTGLVPLKR
jgi:DNA-binding NarL/FixJ family response regulator